VDGLGCGQRRDEPRGDLPEERGRVGSCATDMTMKPEVSISKS
jgi:hypothetical protein